jgi:hypothetical protein
LYLEGHEEFEIEEIAAAEANEMSHDDVDDAEETES